MIGGLGYRDTWACNLLLFLSGALAFLLLLRALERALVVHSTERAATKPRTSGWPLLLLPVVLLLLLKTVFPFFLDAIREISR